jgi:hypothetical protein
MGGTARPHSPYPMGGTARIFSPCAVSWADGLAHGTARHGDTGRHGGVSCQHGTPVPHAASCRHGGHIYLGPTIDQLKLPERCTYSECNISQKVRIKSFNGAPIDPTI